ncbi:hypothetical protein IMZ48_10320, partial [Candidatus Bathyarchaeota archaeon]|nr:hypothetical protein [Candidatus Bathyarchaeota archaeon]
MLLLVALPEPVAALEPEPEVELDESEGPLVDMYGNPWDSDEPVDEDPAESASESASALESRAVMPLVRGGRGTRAGLTTTIPPWRARTLWNAPSVKGCAGCAHVSHDCAPSLTPQLELQQGTLAEAATSGSFSVSPFSPVSPTWLAPPWHLL